MEHTLKKCIVCEKMKTITGNGHVCRDCAPDTLFIPGKRKLKYALILLILLFLSGLILEGLWAAGVFTPHPRLRSPRRPAAATPRNAFVLTRHQIT